MRKFAVILPVFSIAAGICGFFLRKAELLQVFDPVSLLPQRDHPISNYLIALTAFMLFISVVIAIIIVKKYKPVSGFTNTFGTDYVGYPLLFVLFGLIWAGGTLYDLFHQIETDTLNTIDIYFAGLSLLAAVSIASFPIEIYQESKRKTPYVLSILPTFFLCFWLILFYKQNAANPVLLSYAYECLAIISAILCFFITAGFLFDKPAPGKAVFAYCLTIFFCLTTLADNHSIGITIIFCTIIASAAVYLFMLLWNLKKKSPSIIIEIPQPLPELEIPQNIKAPPVVDELQFFEAPPVVEIPDIPPVIEIPDIPPIVEIPQVIETPEPEEKPPQINILRF